MSHASGTGRCAIAWPGDMTTLLAISATRRPRGKNRAVISRLVVVPVFGCESGRRGGPLVDHAWSPRSGAPTVCKWRSTMTYDAARPVSA